MTHCVLSTSKPPHVICVSDSHTLIVMATVITEFWSLRSRGCPTRYRTRHFFNNSNTNEDIATKFEQEHVRCVRNEEECVCSVCL